MKFTRRVLCSLMIAAGANAAAQPLADGMINDNEKLPDAKFLYERAQSLLPTARTETGRAYLSATEHLPKRLRRYMWVNSRFTVAYTESSYAELEDNQKRRLGLRPVTELAYYMGINERPLLDVLPLDLVTTGTELADPANLAGKKILLYNPRVITQGWLLASLGADVTVLHTQRRMRELYSQTQDVGVVEGVNGFSDGSLKLVYSEWPAEESAELDDGFDLVIVSDWISRGLSQRTVMPPRWISAARPMRATEASPDELLIGFAERLAPGGRFINYAYGPMQPRRAANSQPYSNVRIPYSDEALAESGLHALAIDMDDSRAILDASLATDYTDPPLNDEGVPTMIAAYTILTKPAAD